MSLKSMVPRSGGKQQSVTFSKEERPGSSRLSYGKKGKDYDNEKTLKKMSSFLEKFNKNDLVISTYSSNVILKKSLITYIKETNGGLDDLENKIKNYLITNKDNYGWGNSHLYCIDYVSNELNISFKQEVNNIILSRFNDYLLYFKNKGFSQEKIDSFIKYLSEFLEYKNQSLSIYIGNVSLLFLYKHYFFVSCEIKQICDVFWYKELDEFFPEIIEKYQEKYNEKECYFIVYESFMKNN